MALDILQWLFICFLLVLPILYELNSTFKFYAKIFFYYVIVNIIAFGIIPISIFKPNDVTNHRYVVASIKYLRKLFGIEIELRGKEHLVSDKPYILVSNHQSSLDFFGMMEIWPSRCTSLAKKELLYTGPFGLAAWLCGTIFIDRLNHDKAVSTIKTTADIINKKNVKVYVFPEGTRNHAGSLLPFKKGAFYLAVQAQVPIVPVVFSSYSEFYSKREKRFDVGKFIVTCLPPISTRGKTADDVASLTEDVRSQMLDVFNQSSLELRTPKLPANSK